MPFIQEPGRYAATVTAAEFGESETKGTPFLRLDIKTDEGETISAWLYLSEKALPYSTKTLRDAFSFDNNFETAVDQVVGKPCRITVENESYEDENGQEKDRLRVKWINGPSTAKAIDNQDSFLKALSAKAARVPKELPKAGGAAAKPAAAPKAAAPARAAKPAKTENLDEDVPF